MAMLFSRMVQDLKGKVVDDQGSVDPAEGLAAAQQEYNTAVGQ